MAGRCSSRNQHNAAQFRYRSRANWPTGFSKQRCLASGDTAEHDGSSGKNEAGFASCQDFRQPRPDMPPEMEGELEEVVRILAQNRWPWRLHATIARALDVFERASAVTNPAQFIERVPQARYPSPTA
jgi:predicted amidohydrolase YtcJ